MFSILEQFSVITTLLVVLLIIIKIIKATLPLSKVLAISRSAQLEYDSYEALSNLDTLLSLSWEG